MRWKDVEFRENGKEARDMKRRKMEKQRKGAATVEKRRRSGDRAGLSQRFDGLVGYRWQVLGGVTILDLPEFFSNHMDQIINLKP